KIPAYLHCLHYSTINLHSSHRDRCIYDEGTSERARARAPATRAGRLIIWTSIIMRRRPRIREENKDVRCALDDDDARPKIKISYESIYAPGLLLSYVFEASRDENSRHSFRSSYLSRLLPDVSCMHRGNRYSSTTTKLLPLLLQLLLQRRGWQSRCAPSRLRAIHARAAMTMELFSLARAKCSIRHSTFSQQQQQRRARPSNARIMHLFQVCKSTAPTHIHARGSRKGSTVGPLAPRAYGIRDRCACIIRARSQSRIFRARDPPRSQRFIPIILSMSATESIGSARGSLGIQYIWSTIESIYIPPPNHEQDQRTRLSGVCSSLHISRLSFAFARKAKRARRRRRLRRA
ncbi:unnamed protein product, partial [Trichogramma brassicae]